jgi:predicted ATPase
MREESEEVIRRYDRQRHRDHAYFFGGHDARVCTMAFNCMSLWALGLFDQAHRMGLRSIEDARDLGHTFSLAHALHQTSWTFMLLEDVDACQAIADELFPIAERNNFPWPLACARFLQGWLLARQGDRQAGIDQMFKAAAEPSVLYRIASLLPLVAEQQLRDGQHLAALETLERALSSVTSMQTHFCEPEIIRLRGDVLLQQSRANAGEAEAAFRQAIDIARMQSCRALELRSAVSLADLLSNSGRRDEACESLAPIYGTFTEGFDRPDLQAARRLLAELT